MKSIKRFILTALCLVAAILFYFFGVPAGGALFLILGVIFEGIFWVRVFRRDKKTV